MRTTVIFLAVTLLNLQVIFSQENTSLNAPQMNDEIEISVYPNPAKDILHIESDERIDLVKLHNKRGEVVYQAIPQNNQIELSNIQTGFYLMTAYVDGEKLKKRIIKKV